MKKPEIKFATRAKTDPTTRMYYIISSNEHTISWKGYELAIIKEGSGYVAIVQSCSISIGGKQGKTITKCISEAEKRIFENLEKMEAAIYNWKNRLSIPVERMILYGLI